jgi:ligand-binding sensor domain-containing protein
MKRLFFFILIIALHIPTIAQINKQGIPFISNYTPQQYGASDQNWAIVEDSRGVMYFGNNDNGILEYDGLSWRKIPISNNSIVRSLSIDDAGNIYVGAVDEFGVLKPDNLGKLSYVSLSHKIDSSLSNFSDVFKTYACDSLIYFCSRKSIFIYNNQNGIIKSIALPAGAFYSFLIDGKLYLGDYLEGLKVLNKEEFVFVLGGDFFAKKGIYFLDKIPEGFLVGTFPKGLFKLLSNGAIDNSLNNSAANNYLITNQLYHSNKLSENQFAFSTLNQGLIIANQAGSIDMQFNKSLGLQDETVILSYLSNKNTSPLLWLGLNKGISKVEVNSPIHKFGEESGIEGAINDLTIFNNALIVATNYGVYYATNSENNCVTFNQIPGLETLTWSLLNININNQELLLAGTTGGLYAIDKKFQAKNVDQSIRKKGELDLANSITKLYWPDSSKNEILVGKSNGLFSIVYENGSWIRKASFITKNIAIRNILKDDFNNVWIGTYFSGVFKISFSGNDTIIASYGEQKGLKSNKDICFLNYNKQLIAGTEN